VKERKNDPLDQEGGDADSHTVSAQNKKKGSNGKKKTPEKCWGGSTVRLGSSTCPTGRGTEKNDESTMGKKGTAEGEKMPICEKFEAREKRSMTINATDVASWVVRPKPTQKAPEKSGKKVRAPNDGRKDGPFAQPTERPRKQEKETDPNQQENTFEGGKKITWCSELLGKRSRPKKKGEKSLSSMLRWCKNSLGCAKATPKKQVVKKRQRTRRRKNRVTSRGAEARASRGVMGVGKKV